jgi:hypothetical protein
VSEAGKIDRDDVVVLAQRVVNRSPADHGLSYPVEQDERLAHPGAMASKVVGGEGRRLGRDDVSSVGWTAPERADNPASFLSWRGD